MTISLLFPLFSAARQLISDSDAKIVSQYGEDVLKDVKKMNKINKAVEESKKDGAEKTIVVQL